MVLSNPGNQYMSLIAGIAQEPVSMNPKLTDTAVTFSALRLRKHELHWRHRRR